MESPRGIAVMALTKEPSGMARAMMRLLVWQNEPGRLPGDKE